MTRSLAVCPLEGVMLTVRPPRLMFSIIYDDGLSIQKWCLLVGVFFGGIEDLVVLFDASGRSLQGGFVKVRDWLPFIVYGLFRWKVGMSLPKAGLGALICGSYE